MKEACTIHGLILACGQMIQTIQMIALRSYKNSSGISKLPSFKIVLCTLGGHDNYKTRFSDYYGNVDSPLLPEHHLTGKKFMDTANKKMHIEILFKGNYPSYSRDEELVFEINDPEPYNKDYFGFRKFDNHELKGNFNVPKLK